MVAVIFSRLKEGKYCVWRRDLEKPYVLQWTRKDQIWNCYKLLLPVDVCKSLVPCEDSGISLCLHQAFTLNYYFSAEAVAQLQLGNGHACRHDNCYWYTYFFPIIAYPHGLIAQWGYHHAYFLFVSWQ